MDSTFTGDPGSCSARITLNPLRLKIALLALSLGSVGVCFLLLLQGQSPSADVEEWRKVSFVLLVIASLLSAGSFFTRRLAWSFVVLLGKLVLVVLIGLPFEGLTPLKIVLWSSLMLDAGGCLDPPVSIITQAVCLAIIAAFQGPLLAWGKPVAGSNVVELAAVGILLAGLAMVLRLLRSFTSVIQEKSDQLLRLDDAVRHLTLANLSFQKIASTAQERSAEDERKRITRDIHDAIGYALTNLIMMMEAAQRLVPAEVEKLQELLGRAREEAQVGLNETRRALHILRSVPQERVRGLSAIHRLVTIFSKATGVAVKAEYCNADQSYGGEKDMILYRMIQEGMTNSFRHGHATLITLKFWQDERGVKVTIWDNGVGSGDVKEGIGLQGMRERVEQIGGEFRADRVIDGFEIAAWIPLGGEGSEQRTVAGDQDLARSRR